MKNEKMFNIRFLGLRPCVVYNMVRYSVEKSNLPCDIIDTPIVYCEFDLKLSHIFELSSIHFNMHNIMASKKPDKINVNSVLEAVLDTIDEISTNISVSFKDTIFTNIVLDDSLLNIISNHRFNKVDDWFIKGEIKTNSQSTDNNIKKNIYLREIYNENNSISNTIKYDVFIDIYNTPFDSHHKVGYIEIFFDHSMKSAHIQTIRIADDYKTPNVETNISTRIIESAAQLCALSGYLTISIWTQSGKEYLVPLESIGFNCTDKLNDFGMSVYSKDLSNPL